MQKPPLDTTKASSGGGVGGSWPIVDSTRFLTIFYISTIKFDQISTSTKSWKKASIYNLMCSNSTTFRAIFEKLLSTLRNPQILHLQLP